MPPATEFSDAQSPEPSTSPSLARAAVQAYAQRYLAALLRPDTTAAIRIIGEYVQQPDDIPIGWTQIIQPTMYEIGRLWAEGYITVGQEHLATSITQRVMAVYYPLILQVPRTKATIVVAVSPGEFHEVGPRMLADVLEVQGWNVYYTGANTPTDSLAALVRECQAVVLCISTTLTTNLMRVAALIHTIKTQAKMPQVQIIVGGQAYLAVPDLWQKVGADGFAVGPDELVHYLQAYPLLPSLQAVPITARVVAPPERLAALPARTPGTDVQPPAAKRPQTGQLVLFLLEYGADVLLHHTACPIALLDQYGFLLEWNASMSQLKASPRDADNVYQLVVSSSQPRLREMLRTALAGQRGRRETLHFVTNDEGLPSSYECHVVSVPDNRVLFFADPLPPLNEQSVKAYVQVTNELAVTTRELQKAQHELLLREQELTEALVRIERIAYIDELTQVLNRRSLLARLEQEVTRSLVHGTSLTVFLVDADHFKQVNDQHGHQTGDVLLQQLVQRMQHVLRKTDMLGRYGGEEFLVVLPDSDIDAGVQVAERLRAAVAAPDFVINAELTLRKTISMGVAQLNPQSDTVELLLARVDKALYQAKAAGRNRVCVER